MPVKLPQVRLFAQVRQAEMPALQLAQETVNLPDPRFRTQRQEEVEKRAETVLNIGDISLFSPTKTTYNPFSFIHHSIHLFKKYLSSPYHGRNLKGGTRSIQMRTLK